MKPAFWLPFGRFLIISLTSALILWKPARTYGQMLEPLGNGIRGLGRINAWVYDSTTNKLYAGGIFEKIGNTEASNIAVYDGTSWSPLGSGVHGKFNSVTNIAILNGIVYVAGYFSDAGGVPVSNIAAWDGQNWQAVGQLVTSYGVSSLEVFENELYLSAFLAISQPPEYGIAKYDGSTWSVVGTSNPGASNIILKTKNDSLHVYGIFETLNGDSLNAYSIYNNGQFLDFSLPPAFSWSLEQSFYKGTSYIVSNGGQLMHLDGNSWVIDSAVIDADSKMFVYNDSLYGFKTSYGPPSEPDTAIMYNLHNGTLYRQLAKTTYDFGSPFYYLSHIEYNDTMLFSAPFTNFNLESIDGTVSFDGNNFEESTLKSGFPEATVNALFRDTISGDVIAGGDFQFAGDVASKRIARWDGSTWHAIGQGFNGMVNKILKYQDTLYAAGRFTLSGNVSVSHIARWDGNTWQPVGTGADGNISDMEIYDGKLFVGGNFSTFNGMSANNIVFYSNGTWLQAGSSGLDEIIYGLETFNGELIAYSRFQFGPLPNGYSYFASFNSSTNAWSAALLNGPPTTVSIKTIGNKFYASRLGNDPIYCYTGGVWDSAGTSFPYGSNSFGGLHALDTTLLMSRDGVSMLENNSWTKILDFSNVYDIVKIGQNKFILGGSFSHYYHDNQMFYLNNIGEFEFAIPPADFETDSDTLCENKYVTFNSPPSIVPTTYEWTFPGGIPSTSSSSMPIIKYVTPGTHDVSLKVTTFAGTDSVNIPDAVHVFNCGPGSEEHDNVWIMGYHYFSDFIPTLDFYYNPPDTAGINTALEFWGMSTSICNAQGNLKLYTNGTALMNYKNDTVPGSHNFNYEQSLYGNISGAIHPEQSVYIIPRPGYSTHYSMFHLCRKYHQSIHFFSPVRLGWSLVNINGQGGNGYMFQKDSTVLSDTLMLSTMNLVKHANGRDWWVLNHKFQSDIFYLALHTPDGIDTVISQAAGPPIISDPDVFYYAQSCFSPDGSKFIMVRSDSNMVYIFNFDRCEGILTLVESWSIPELPAAVTGCSVSPDSRYLYVSTYLELFQYDLTAASIAQSEVFIDYWDGTATLNPNYFIKHRLAPDGKIYIFTGPGQFLHVINDPNQPGTLCQLTQHSQQLRTNHYTRAPDFPNFRLGSVPGTVCDSLSSIWEYSDIELSITCFPNPAGTSTNFSYFLDTNRDGLLKIYDVSGRLIKTEKLAAFSTKKSVNVSSFPEGLYTAIIESGSYSGKVRFAVMHPQ